METRWFSVPRRRRCPGAKRRAKRRRDDTHPAKKASRSPIHPPIMGSESAYYAQRTATKVRSSAIYRFHVCELKRNCAYPLEILLRLLLVRQWRYENGYSGSFRVHCELRARFQLAIFALSLSLSVWILVLANDPLRCSLNDKLCP